MFGRKYKMMENRVAILDLGTNTFHLLIAELTEDSFRIIHKKKFPVRLGEGGINEGIITKSAEKRALSAIKEISGMLRDYNIFDVKAIATSAIRNASNGQKFLRKIKSRSGIDINVIDGSTEAEYIYYGVCQAIDIGDNPVLIMDIGGGSVEFIIANQHNIFWKKSFEIGAQRLFEEYHRHDPVTKNDLISLYQYLEIKLISLFDALHHYHPKTLIGCSGTFDTISDIYCLKNNIIKNPEDTEQPIEIRSFHHIHEDLIRKNIQERLAIPGMSPMRADMINMSSSLIHFIISQYNFERLRASNYSLKEGIISLILKKAQIQELSA
jgi:exopolyphosphatase/guanosine-5'-triphosphate,3'-diphosphate pyrophosphatase